MNRVNAPVPQQSSDKSGPAACGAARDPPVPDGRNVRKGIPKALEGRPPAHAVGPAHRGQGLAVRAVRVMAAYAFEQLGAEQ